MPRADYYRIVFDFIRMVTGSVPSRAEADAILDRLGPEEEAVLLRLRRSREALFVTVHRRLADPDLRPVTDARPDDRTRAVQEIWRELARVDLSLEDAVGVLAGFDDDDRNTLDRYLDARRKAIEVVERNPRSGNNPGGPAAVRTVSTALRDLRTGTVHRVSNLTIFTLHREEPADPCLLLSEATDMGTVEVGEVSEGGRVPEILVRNRSDRRILILQGEILEGARQNRTANTDVLVAPKSDLVIPVSCIEQGRWRYRSRHFSSEGAVIHPELRAAVNREVTRNIREEGKPDASQGEVWGMVAAKMRTLGVSSPTASLSEAFEKARPRFADYEALVPHLRGAQGLAAAIGERIVLVEVFETAHQLELLAEKLIDSLAADALEELNERGDQPTPSEGAVRRLLDDLAGAEATESPGVGLGTDVRLDAADCFGSGLVFEGRLVHLAAYPGGRPRRRRAPLL